MYQACVMCSFLYFRKEFQPEGLVTNFRGKNGGFEMRTSVYPEMTLYSKQNCSNNI